MKQAVIGFVTIGQSPRTDIMDDIQDSLPKEVEVIQVGALDHFANLEEVSKVLRPEPGETVYVTRMRSGQEVKISKEKLMPLMKEKIEQLDKINVDAVVIMCSGEFPEFESYSIVIYPDKILKGIVSSIHYKGNAAVLVPSTDHLQYGYNKWSKYFPEPLIVPISPYTAGLDEFVQVGQRLRKADVKLVVMDCVGYSFRQKKALRKTAPSAKIMSTRGVVGKIVSELF